GIVYEHQPASVPALRVMRVWQHALAEIERRGQALRPAVIAPVLRRIEQLARDAAKTLGVEGDGPMDVAVLDFLERGMRGSAAGDRDAPAPERGGAGGGLLRGADAPSGLIVP